MKKLFASLTGTAAFLSVAAPAFAQPQGGTTSLNPCDTGEGSALDAACAASGQSLGSILGFVITIAFVIAVLIALFFLLYGGIKWITSGGDKAGVEAARNQIIAAVIGLIIVFLSFFILNLVLGFFDLSLFDLQLPTLIGS